MNRSRGVVVFDNGKSIAATRLSRSLCHRDTEMPLEDVYLVSQQLDLVRESEIDELEMELGFPLPGGYREYLRHLGNGNFCHGLHVRTPSEVLDQENMKYWADYLSDAIENEFFDERPLLTDSELKNTVVFAHSEEGDYFVSCPERQGQIFELPRHESRMHHYPEGFFEPFKFEFCRISEFNLPFFEPPNSRQARAHLPLRENANIQELWDHVANLGPSPLQVAQGEIGRTDHVVAFIPDILGCAWLDNTGFYVFSSSEHAHILDDIRHRFVHLTVA